MKAKVKGTAERTALKFDEVEYLRLRMLIQDAELITVQAQAAANKAVAAREAYLKELAAKYGFEVKPTTQIAWNDETHEFSFT